MLTRQEIVNKVFDTFVTKKTPRAIHPTKTLFFNENKPMCTYSPAVNGCGCAVGCLLPTDKAELLASTNDGMSVLGIMSKKHWLNEYLDHSDSDILSDLQHWHDSNEDLTSPLSIERFVKICKKYNVLSPL